MPNYMESMRQRKARGRWLRRFCSQNSGDLNDSVLFTGKHSVAFSLPAMRSLQTAALSGQTHWKHYPNAILQLKTPGPWNIFHTGPFTSLTDKNSDIREFEVFPFSTLTCAQRFDRSSMICESDRLSAEAVSPSSARTHTQPEENLYFNVIATILGLLLIVFGINGNSAS